MRACSRSGQRDILALALAASIALTVTAAWAGAPTDQLRSSVDQVIRLLQGTAPAGNARRVALLRAIEPRFDLVEMARRALGRYWRDRTDREREQFVALFGELLRRAYLTRIEAYAGERVDYTGETVDGDYATVRTRIETRHDADIPVTYRMIRRGDDWLVYDVLVEGVSLVENYRAQFNTIIETSSYAELVTKMSAKLHEEEQPRDRANS